MNVKLAPKKPEPRRPIYAVSVNGKDIGLVEPYQETEWHAQLKIKTGNGYPDHFLIQGFGETAEAAILAAFETGLAEHQLAAALIAAAMMDEKNS